MKNLKFGSFFLGLALAVGGAVSLAAQDRTEVRPRGRADVMLLGGGGQLGLRVSDTAAGVRVDDVNGGSPAEKAGVKEGDLVVEFDGERVRSARQFSRLVQETPDGRTVKMAVMRNGQKQTLDATPENRAATFTFDGNLLRDEIERGMREFHWETEPPAFNFRFDDRGPRRFDYRFQEPMAPSRGRLGVSVQSLTPELEEFFGAKDGGVLVSSVAPDSAAAKAGIKAGDVITTINGRRVADAGSLMREVRDMSGEVSIGLLRDKKEMTVKATIDGRRAPL